MPRRNYVLTRVGRKEPVAALRSRDSTEHGRTEQQTSRKFARRGWQTDPLREAPEQEGEGEQNPEL